MDRFTNLLLLCGLMVWVVGGPAIRPAGAGVVFTNFDAPPPDAEGVQISGINDDGDVVGVVFDAQFNGRGFIRKADGQLLPFPLPNGSSNGPFQTQLGGINGRGEVVGYLPTIFGAHGNPILVFQDGVITAQIPLPPEFGNSSVRGINNAGVMVGSENDLIEHKAKGFVRDPDGRFTTFDAAPTTPGTQVSGINGLGTAIGNYLVFNLVTAGFERLSDGTIVLLPTPPTIGGKAVVSLSYNGINDEGITVGTFQDPTSAVFGFTRDAVGNFTRVASPDNPVISGLIGINNESTMTGVYFDSAGTARGFIATPGENGDMNCDGVKDGADLQDLILALQDPDVFAVEHPECSILDGDFTGDERLTFDDIPGMVNCLLNGFCP